MQVTLHLHGAIAEAVGQKTWVCQVDTVSEALRLVEANTQRLVGYLSKNLQTSYHVMVDNTHVATPEELDGLYKKDSVEAHVVPILHGSGNGGFLALIGLAILAIVLFPGGAYSAIAAKTALSFSQSFFLTLGASITLAGVSQLVIGTPKVENSERPANKPSYIFTGQINTYRQGNPVAVGFGRMKIGSQVISAGVRNVDVLPPVT